MPRPVYRFPRFPICLIQTGSLIIVIAVTGANGYIGASLIRHLHGVAGIRSASLRAVVRRSRAAAQARELPARLVEVDYGDPASLAAGLRGADALVHLAGALQPRRGETLYGANVATTRSVVHAARTASVRALVYVSAPGASPDSPNDYLRSKGMAEALVRELGLSGAILRVPMVLGRGSASLETLRHMARARFVPLVMGGRVRVQPVAQKDVIGAIDWAMARDAGPIVTLDLVGPDSLFYVELLRKVAERLGTRPRVLFLPKRLVESGSRLAGWVPAVGWNWSLFDTLFNEHLADPSPAQKLLPFELTRVDALLDQILG